MPPDQAPAASEPAAAPAAPAPAAASPSPAPAPVASAPAAPASAPAEPSTLLTAAAAAPAQADPTKPAAAPEPAKEPGAETDEEKAAREAAELHAPEQYEDFKLPENVKLDDAFLTEFKATAKELDLPQGKAQKLVELGAKMQADNATRFVAELQGTVDRSAREWEASVKKDPELGGDRHEEVMGVAATALKTFGTPEFKKFLDESRLGSHPEMVRLLYKAGKHISQDPVVPGRSTTGTKSDHEVFYAKE